MMKKLIYILLLLPFWSFGQLSVAVDCAVDSIKFGDEVVFSYKVNVPDGVNLNSLDFSDLVKIGNAIYEQDTVNLDKYMDVDILDGGVFGISNERLITTKPNSGSIPLEGSIKLRFSSIGAFLLPIPKLVHLSTAQEIPLQRKPLFVLPLEAMELNPNRSIIEEETSWWDYGKWVLLWIGILALGGFGYWYLTSRKKKDFDPNVEKQTEIKLPAHEIALKDLFALKEKELWQNGKEKEYHSELTKIMRQYVEDRYDIQALEMTTSQLNRSMSEGGLDKNVIIKFVDILQIADKVKFAKGKTGPEINEQFLKESVQIVKETLIVPSSESTEE